MTEDYTQSSEYDHSHGQNQVRGYNVDGADELDHPAGTANIPSVAGPGIFAVDRGLDRHLVEL
jgi:hypothetical protein